MSKEIDDISGGWACFTFIMTGVVLSMSPFLRLVAHKYPEFWRWFIDIGWILSLSYVAALASLATLLVKPSQKIISLSIFLILLAAVATYLATL